MLSMVLTAGLLFMLGIGIEEIWRGIGFIGAMGLAMGLAIMGLVSGKVMEGVVSMVFEVTGGLLFMGMGVEEVGMEAMEVGGMPISNWTSSTFTLPPSTS